MILTLNPFHKTPEIVDPVGPETPLANAASELYLEGHTEQALEVALKSLQIARTVAPLLNTSIILEVLGRFDEALGYAAEAWHLSPGDKRTAGHYGRSLLRQGDLARGWPLYLQDCNLRSQLKDFIPEWTDQGLAGKRLLVVEGEGYGDNIYFMRWLHALRDLGATVDYICQPSLAPLVEHMGFRALPNWGGNVDFRFTDYDYHTSILTLPHKFGVTYDNYKWNGPYISVASPTRRKIAGQPLRVGICALAGEGMSPTKQRSMHASQLQHMLNSLERKHQWVNLTYAHKLLSPVENPIIENWLDTAKAISTCDFVVSVDTGVAHLAGAMGVLTWVLLPGASAWQYPIKRNEHPLYPSMRMFRNYGKGLENVVKVVSDHLSRLQLNMEIFPDFSEWLTGKRLGAEEQAWTETQQYKRNIAQVLSMIHRIGIDRPTVVELGCGSGWIPTELSKITRYLGVDKNPDLLELCIKKNSPEAIFCLRDIRSVTPETLKEFLGVPSADIVCSFAVLKHFGLHEWKDVFQKMLSLGNHGVFQIQVSDQASEDDGKEYHHTWLNKEEVRECIIGAEHEILSFDETWENGIFREWTIYTKRIL